MKKYAYRVTVEALNPVDGEASAAPLRFDFGTHEDLSGIIHKLGAREGFTPDTARAFGVGLKLFSEVVRSHKDTSPFAEMMPHLNNIMKEIKKKARNGD